MSKTTSRIKSISCRIMSGLYLGSRPETPFGQRGNRTNAASKLDSGFLDEKVNSLFKLTIHLWAHRGMRDNNCAVLQLMS